MKKFYYKKGEPSIDKTPIILRLDRRHTVNVDKEEVGRYTRATSISSLDQLKDIPTLPRTKRRGVTKSLSEDFPSSGKYGTPSTVIITETELSSSWLYKNMKAAVNSKEENENAEENTSRTSLSQPNFSPVMLQDPRMKPVPIPTTPRPERTSSQVCYIAIMMVISICTIGFVSTIGGIIYLEVFSNRNIVVNPTVDSQVDVSEPLYKLEAGNSESTEHSYKAEVNKYLDHESSKLPESGELGDGIEMEDTKRNTVRILDFGKPLGTELTQFIDNSRTEIKLKKDYSVTFQGTSSNSDEEESSLVAIRIEDDKIKIRDNFESNSNVVSVNSVHSVNNMTDVANENLDKIPEKYERYLPPRFNQSINLISQKGSITNLQETSTVIYEDLNFESSTESVSDSVSIEPEDRERNAQNDKETLMENSSKETDNDHNDRSNELINTEITHRKENEIQENSELPIKSVIEAKKSEIQNMNVASVKIGESGGKDETVKTVLDKGTVENVEKTESNKDEAAAIEIDTSIQIDVKNESGKSMITVLNETINDISNKDPGVLFSNRNGVINPSGLKSLDTGKPPKVKIRRPSADFSQTFQQKIPQNLKVKKPVDIQVSLAEAMKHLQELDINKKLPSFRAKSEKTKVKAKSQRPRTSLNQNKEEKAMEQMRYLEKLRLLLYDKLGGN